MDTWIKKVIPAVVGALTLWLVAFCLAMPTLGQEGAPNSSVPAIRTVTELVASPDGIDLVTDGPLDSYTAIPLMKPDRLVIDLPGVRSGVGAEMVPLNVFGIDSARVVELQGKCRIVFEGKDGRVRQATVTRTDRGLRLQPATPGASPGRPVAESPPVRRVPGHDVSHPTVESLDFGVVESGSRITMKVSGSCVASQPFKSSEGVSFSVNNCSLPRNLARTLDTSSFASVVQAVIPYQVSLKGVPETRVIVKLERDATWSLRQDVGAIVLDIIHPKVAEKAGTSASAVKVVSGRQPQPSTASPAAEAGASPAEKPFKSLSGGKKQYTGQRITLEFTSEPIDVRKIFPLIADVNKKNYIIGDDVAGKISSMKLVNVPWDQALDTILETNGLGMEEEGDIVFIKPKSKIKSAYEESLAAEKSRLMAMELKTRVFNVNYASIGEVKALFDEFSSRKSLERKDASVTMDTRTNKIIVTDIAPVLQQMASLLENIDLPERQVLIEARIVEASTKFTRDFGIQWGIQYRDPSASILGIQRLDTVLGGAVTPLTALTSDKYGMATGINFGTLTSNINVDLRLSAAVTAELIKIISTPKIATLNNKPAKITQGQSIPYSNTTANTGAVTQFVEAALTLEVTPQITPDGSVMMKIKASNNSPGTLIPGSTTPPIDKKEATTELLVKNGETTVIGGIYIDNDNESDSGVPYLMDIPLIGWMFKSNHKFKTKTELLIFITPRILS